MENYVNYLVKWLQDRVNEANAKGLIVGISGGIDSAVVANLVKLAFPDNSLGLILPCYSSDEDVEHGLCVVKDCMLDYKIVDLDNVYDKLVHQISLEINETSSFQLAKANTKARLRMTTLYAIAQNYGYLVCGTDNACEWYTGYFTKYGDGGVDIAPLIQLTKTQVYELAHYFKINDEIINKPPSAGLIDNQTDEEEMQVSYQELEAYLNNEKVSENAKQRIDFLHNSSNHKRNGIAYPTKKVSEIK
ncbi:NAD+ synthase [Bacilli bacterium PM5-3]|nr:NAD+ synthase [Bacilli bacterium PM5-3]MDH6603100.1 NAD+ synthase [Bacilli bacterium PM5-9]